MYTNMKIYARISFPQNQSHVTVLQILKSLLSVYGISDTNNQWGVDGLARGD